MRAGERQWRAITERSSSSPAIPIRRLPKHRRLPRHADDQGGGPPLRRHGNFRRDPGERPRRRRVRHPVDVVSRQRPPDGIADHHRRAAARLGAAHHGGDPLFRLCPAGPQSRAAHADLGQARRQPHHPCRRRPRAHARSARRADPGLLRHPDRQSVRRAGDGARHPAALRPRQGDRGVAGRRRRGARARARQAHQCTARHHRQEARTAGRIRGGQRHRRGRRRHLHPGRRHRGFRRYAGQRRRRAVGEGRQRGLRLYHSRRAVGRRGRPRRQIPAQGTGDHGFDPGDQGRHRVAISACCRLRR
jgi:hypothetical protein